VPKCPNCQHDYAEGVIICDYCGYVVDSAAIARHTETQRFGESETGQNQPRWGSARFDEQTRLLLRLMDSGQTLYVEVRRPEGITLGRYDPHTQSGPDIDLTGFDAEKLGVSRRHAQLTVQDNSLYITDLDAANGTYLNGLRLTTRQPRILRDGDEIRLGHLKLLVTFVDMVNK